MRQEITISRLTGEILEYRIFSTPDFLIGTIHTIGIIQQLVKLTNIYSGIDADQNFKHWIIETLQNVYIRNSLNKTKRRPLIGGSQSMFVLNEDKKCN